MINSEGQILAIEDIKLIPEEFLISLKKDDCFLDNVSGDIFEFIKVRFI